MRLEDIIGQERAIGVLRSALRRDRVAHSYLFAGPESVGKSTAALVFAQALNCEGEAGGLGDPEAGDLGPCGVCQSCRLIARGNHPDVRLITLAADAQGKQRTEISIDQIRQNPRKPRQTPLPLIQDAYLKPALGRHKVYLVDPADRMNAEAGNALLKVLEEPPPHVVIILVTAEPSSLLPTVVSRCQQVLFRLVGVGAIAGHLRSLGVSPVTAASLAGLSGGRIAWAIRAAQRPDVLAARMALLDLCAGMAGRPVSASLRVAEEVKRQASRLAVGPGEAAEEEEGEDATGLGGMASDRVIRAELPWCLDIMVSWYRDVLGVAHGTTLLNPDYQNALRARARAGEVGQAERAIESILETKHAIQHNANIDTALESLAVCLAGWCD